MTAAPSFSARVSSPKSQRAEPAYAHVGHAAQGRFRADGASPWIWAAAALVWAWALALLSTRESLVELYLVIASAPPLWGFLVLPIEKQLAILSIGVLLAVIGIRSTPKGSNGWPRSIRWLLAAAVIPLLDALRIGGGPVPATFLEPLYFTFATGMAARNLAAESNIRPWWPTDSPRWFWLTVGTAVAATLWWYWEGQQAYANFLLGYHDFGHFARRIINTWEGRGWLLESPGVPAYWDHFNPGLVLLAPLWGLIPDARLFLGLQAICLASPALLAFGIARRYDCDAMTSTVWSLTFLAFPSLGLLNLSYSYGWHPVSVAVPLMFLAVWALLTGRRIVALIAIVLACSFQESVIVVAGCLAAALALQGWLAGGRMSDGWRSGLSRRVGQTRLADCLPVWGWWMIWAAMVIAFLLIARYASFMEFQTGRFSRLGDSFMEIALSPLLRPVAFWGRMARMVSLYFLLGMLVPWHLPNVARGWPMLLAMVLPMTVLLAWEHGPAASLAFQYVSESLIVLYLAALGGSGSRIAVEPSQTTRTAAAPQQRVRAVAALACALTASSLYGSLPWSSPTLNLMITKSYDVPDQADLMFNPRAVGTAGHEMLSSIVARVEQNPDVAVLATGRIASHLLRVRRLESVEQALVRWDLLTQEMGEDRSPIEAFDWVILDRYERFQQSLDRTLVVLDAARQAGYRIELDQDGLIVLRRPSRSAGDTRHPFRG